MERPLVEVMPEDARRQVAHGVEIVVGNHLWLPARAARKVHEHGVTVVVNEGGPLEPGCLAPLRGPVVPGQGAGLRLLCAVAAVGAAHLDEYLQRGALVDGGLYLADDIVVIGADNGLDRCARVAVDDVVLREHVCGGNGHGAYLAQCEHAEPPLVVSLQDEHDRVVLPYAQRQEVAGGLVGLLLQLAKRRAYLDALVVRP